MASITRFIPSGLGWQRDLPDPRDYTPEHPEISKIMASLPPADFPLPARIDLRSDEEGSYFSPPDDQGRCHSSSSFACLALVEYFERKTIGRTFEGSALFLYEMSRKLSGATANAGVGIRASLKALRRYGAPPEEMRPYSDEPADGNPVDISLMGFSQHLQSVRYFRLDQAEQSGWATLGTLKSFLAAGFPVALGFTVPRSLDKDGLVPFRPRFDSYRGGQAVLAVGYDDQRLPGNQGAVLIRSSWGPRWGEAGYGWLPYALVIHQQAADFWTMLSLDWAQTRVLAAPATSASVVTSP